VSRVYDLIILGAGASGLMAAAQINEQSDMSVLIIEGNKEAAKKIKISGGGKCNITNIDVSANNYLGDIELIENIFMQFSKEDLLTWLKARGLEPVLRKERYYFCAQSADEIITLLKDAASKSHYKYDHKIMAIKKEQHFSVKTDKGTFKGHRVLIATGAKSFASVGATDIGVELAQSLGHKSTPFLPALAGFTLQSSEAWMKALSGISFKAAVEVEGKRLQEDMLLTHRGLSGPVILSASLYWSKGKIEIDFLADNSLENIMKKSKKLFSTALPLPKRFSQALLEAVQIKDKPCDAYKAQEMEQLKSAFHHYTFAPAGTYGFAQAEVCKGGVVTNELNPWTLESNIVEGLYFSGEVLDITGELGGYNFQWAFSSAVVVATNIINS